MTNARRGLEVMGPRIREARCGKEPDGVPELKNQRAQITGICANLVVNLLILWRGTHEVKKLPKYAPKT
jgi:hypothetical protein